MNNTEFTYATFIDTTPEKLWHAITDRDFLQKYWGLLESDWQVGSGLTMFTDESRESIGFIGKVLRSEPPNLLSYTFHPQDTEENRGLSPSQVTFEIKAYTDVVKLVVTHVEIPNNHESLVNGWQAILSNLKSVIETGKPLSAGIWDWHRERGYICVNEMEAVG